MSDDHFMKLAIEKTREGILKGQTPFGTTIVKDGKVVACAHNRVWLEGDPTAHAEVNAIREASRFLKTIDLSGCTLYSTCEPCPMCLSACHWSKIDRVLFGATIADAEAAGFLELQMPAKELAKRGGSDLIVELGPLQDECKGLFQTWKDHGKNKSY